MAPYYPAPTYDTIVEPFAGAAGYATRYPERNVILVDRDPVIAGVWEYLIHVSPDEILRLPVKLAHVDELHVCQEAKWLIGFWLDKGGARPAKRPSPRMVKPGWAHRPKSHWGPEIRERIASQVPYIRHWQVEEGWYDLVPDITATWFIDPPYQATGSIYRFGPKFVDYESLALFVKSRRGQVIACESAGATWLPFTPFRVTKSTHKGGATVNKEMVYLQETQAPWRAA